MKKYVANYSGGKDSTAMVLRLIEEQRPLTDIVFYDTGCEFQAVYNNVERMQKLAVENGVCFRILKPETSYLYEMLLRPVNLGKPNEKYGRGWCSNRCRHLTAGKVGAINRFLGSLGEYEQYVGMAADEPGRLRCEANKRYPLDGWGMTEADCLRYCYSNGWNWDEDGVELYSVLSRVSCFCCGNKNLSELRAYRKFLPRYWALLKGLQSRIDEPFYQNQSIFDLERRFEKEDLLEQQLSFYDFMDVGC